MSKFDLIFEKALRSLREEQTYTNSTFRDNILQMLNVLSKHDYISETSEQDINKKADEVLNQKDSTKYIDLAPKPGLPTIRLVLAQDNQDSESFSVAVIDTENPSEQLEFKTNTHLETIFDDVLNQIKTMSLQRLKPEAAVDTLPPTEGAQAQPGAEQSALPTA